MRAPGIDEKVAFLSRPEAYPGQTERVETKQTHASWIFLTETQAWKLKKPVRMEYLDFSTLESRRCDSEREVRLNRRLAPDVYHGVIVLTVSSQGNLELGGTGEPVDWLVCMRRLPRHLMLDQFIASGAVSREDVINLASVLVAFYKKAPPVRITGSQHRKRLATHIRAARSQITKTEYGLPARFVEPIVSSQLDILEKRPSLFDQRIVAGKIIEAHGDLRPEHICLERPPVIIDCLEFNRNLRILDIASELAFLALECERLGAPEIGKCLFKTYTEETGDRPCPELLEFYKRYHACVRAQIALWHLKDGGVLDRTIWIDKAKRYLELSADAYMAA